jgi:hypothetical protein
MTIFGLALIFFTLLSAAAWMLFQLLDKKVLAPIGERALMRRQALEESHVWWLTSVIYIGFAGLCFFMIGTAIGVELYLGNYLTVARLLLMTGIAVVIAAVTIYLLIRSFIGHFVV